MPDILIRDVPQEVLDALEQRATAHGRSLNDEILEILRNAAFNIRVEVMLRRSET